MSQHISAPKISSARRVIWLLYPSYVSSSFRPFLVFSVTCMTKTFPHSEKLFEYTEAHISSTNIHWAGGKAVKNAFNIGPIVFLYNAVRNLLPFYHEQQEEEWNIGSKSGKHGDTVDIGKTIQFLFVKNVLIQVSKLLFNYCPSLRPFCSWHQSHPNCIVVSNIFYSSGWGVRRYQRGSCVFQRCMHSKVLPILSTPNLIE